MLQPTAAGHLHAQHRNAANIVAAKNFRQLISIVRIVQLGTANQGNPATHEIPMDRSISKGRAVGGNQQFRTRKIRRTDRRQAQLAGPLMQLRSAGRALGKLSGIELTNLLAGAAALSSLSRLLLAGAHRRLIKGGSFALHKSNGVGGTGGQAVAQTVAVILAQQSGLAIYHADCALLTGMGAQAAADAFILVDADNLANHLDTPYA